MLLACCRCCGRFLFASKCKFCFCQWVVSAGLVWWQLCKCAERFKNCRQKVERKEPYMWCNQISCTGTTKSTQYRLCTKQTNRTAYQNTETDWMETISLVDISPYNYHQTTFEFKFNLIIILLFVYVAWWVSCLFSVLSVRRWTKQIILKYKQPSKHITWFQIHTYMTRGTYDFNKSFSNFVCHHHELFYI